MEQEYVSIDLREIFSLIKKNILALLLCIFAGALIALLVSQLLLTPRYEASATLVVNTRDEQATVVTYDQINSARQLVATYAVILTNDALMSEIIAEFGLDTTPEGLRSRISASPVDQTQIMKLTVQHANAELALAIVTRIIDRAPEILINTVKAGSVEIVSPPSIKDGAVFPRTRMNVVLGAGAGLVLCLGFIFIRKALNNTFVVDDDIDKHLGLPTLGVIPTIRLEEEGHARG